MRTLITGGMLVTPTDTFVADLLLADGRIDALGNGLPPDVVSGIDDVVDASGCYVFPGGVDVHTHVTLDIDAARGTDAYREATLAAVMGGTTTLVDHMAFYPQGRTLREHLADYHALAEGRALADYGFHGLVQNVDEALSDLDMLVEAGCTSIKAYMTYDHRVGDDGLLRLLRRTRELGLLLAVHAENHDIIHLLRAECTTAERAQPIGHARTRPDRCEAEAVSRLLYLAHLAGDAPVNVVHLSTKLGLEAIRAAKARGQKNIYVETCPQYLMLDDTCYLEQGEDGFAGAKYVMSPPLRHAGDRVALREALVAGEIDTIATDHCSFNLHGQKDRGRGDFRAIPNGGPGVEHRPVAIATSFEGQLGPEDLCRLMSENPARVFGMYPRKGCLAEGADADVCVWDPKARWTISAATQHQAVDYTPLGGFEAHGRAKAVFVNGVLAARDGEPTGAQPGRYVPR